MDEKTFEHHAIIELFGHNQIAGFVSEQSIGGASFIRVDVPDIGDVPGFTKYFGSSAIYAITPTTAEIVYQAARRLDIRPVSLWVVPDAKPQLPPIVNDDNCMDDDNIF